MDVSRRPLTYVIGTALIAVTVLLYAPVRQHVFVDYDDQEYVVANHHVNRGLTLQGIAWAFTRSHSANWHPVTYMSHMLDCQLFGVDAGPHLMVNVLFHAASALLLFLFLARTTGGIWPSAFVAAVFALHPLRVESVAWVSERKDVLATFFWMLTLHAYAAYVRVPTWSRYALVGGAYALGLMSKPMVVTLPFVLLLLDVWPLRRAPGTRSWGPARSTPGSCPQLPVLRWRALLLEKAPLLMLAAASSAVTVLAQRQWGAVMPMEAFGLGYRMQNAVLSCALYLRDSLWPAGLAVLYPIRDPLPPVAVAIAAATLLGISILVVLSRRPYLLVGWLWYLGVLVPVIGIVWVGDQSRADRFTYLPQIGLAIMVGWGFLEVLERRRWGRTALAVGAVAAITVGVVATRRQIGFWRDGTALFGRAIAVTDGNYAMHVALGTELSKAGRREEARAHYLEALRLKPDFARAHLRLGVLLADEGRIDEAIERYQLVMHLRPDYSAAPFNLGLALAARGQTAEAIRFYEEALRIEPDYGKAHVMLALALDEQGRREEAAEHLRAALAVEPDMVEAHGNLAIILEGLGRAGEALEQYRETVRLAPDDVRARLNLGSVLEGVGQIDEARVQYQEALRLKPGAPEIEDALARLGAGVTSDGGSP